MAVSMKMPKFLIWGEKSWIAGHLKGILMRQGKDVHTTGVRMEKQAEVYDLLDRLKPTHLINCAGKTGYPNVDWCEEHKVETIESNALGTQILAKACHDRGIHMTVMATGCIYRSTYNEDRTMILSKPFKETDPANFDGSFYSAGKSRVEFFLKTYPNCLILRLRMPVSDDLFYRSFVTKISKYDNVVNVPNSHSILTDLLPVVIALSEHQETGVFNFANPGAISHNEVLQLYRDNIDSAFTWQNFTVEEQAEVITADRSNCELDTSKLQAKVREYAKEGYDVEVPEIHEAYQRCFERMKTNLQQKPGAQVATAV